MAQASKTTPSHRAQLTRAFCLAALGAIASPDAGAQEVTLPERLRPAVAKLNYAEYDRRTTCTAALLTAGAAIAPRRCLPGTATSPLHLLFGYEKGSWYAHRRVSKAFFDPDGGEVVLLCLDAEVPNIADYEAPVAPSDGSEVVVTGYWAPKLETLGQMPCRSRGQTDQRTMLACEAPPGRGGSAAFAVSRSGAALLGIAVGGGPGTIIIEGWRGAAARDLCGPTDAN